MIDRTHLFLSLFACGLGIGANASLAQDSPRIEDITFIAKSDGLTQLSRLAEYHVLFE